MAFPYQSSVATAMLDEGAVESVAMGICIAFDPHHCQS
jgi:hypothetical protein